MNLLLVATLLFTISLSTTQAKLGSPCLEDTDCELDRECCVVSSFVIKRGKCSVATREGTRCHVGKSYESGFWNLPYRCGCAPGLTCVEETWQDEQYPGVDLKRDRCRGM